MQGRFGNPGSGVVVVMWYWQSTTSIAVFSGRVHIWDSRLPVWKNTRVSMGYSGLGCLVFSDSISWIISVFAASLSAMNLSVLSVRGPRPNTAKYISRAVASCSVSASRCAESSLSVMYSIGCALQIIQRDPCGAFVTSFSCTNDSPTVDDCTQVSHTSNVFLPSPINSRHPSFRGAGIRADVLYNRSTFWLLQNML